MNLGISMRGFRTVRCGITWRKSIKGESDKEVQIENEIFSYGQGEFRTMLDF